jgi:hypothetical protein
VVCVAGLVVAALAGCRSQRSVAVRVSIPNADGLETPALGVGIIALPYDRDSVLASLEARAPTPRPPTGPLDSLFARFRGPFTTYTKLSYAASSLRDSLGALRRGLDTATLDSADRQSFARVKQLEDSLRVMESRLERARIQLDRARAEFVQQSESLRAAVRQWEDSTYRGYDSIVEQLARSRGGEASTDTTGETGWAHFELGRGDWWLYARAWDTSDPNAEWYWNVPVSDDTVLLSSRTGRRRPRY